MDPDLAKAVRAAADLSEPVRCFPDDRGGGFVYQTAKGENVPSDVSEQSVEEMTAYMEEILRVLDKEIARNEDEDSVPVDFLTAPPWFGPYKYMDAHYVLDDLSFQLDPNRAKTVPVGEDLGQILETTCRKDASCVFRKLYPEVGSAGPVALSSVTIALLTEMTNVASANETALRELSDTLLAVLAPKCVAKLADDASPLGPQISGDVCICCLLTAQTRACIDASSETACEDVDGLIKSTTFVGVLKTAAGDVRREIDAFAPQVNVHYTGTCYLADESPFREYRLVKDTGPDGEPLWVVRRDEAAEAPRIPGTIFSS